jgi:hypothetical protein
MPPRSRNHRDPTGPDTPHATAASSLVIPSAIFTQNARSRSRRIGGLPGERIDGLPVCVTIHCPVRPNTHLLLEVLRRPVEFALRSSVGMKDDLVGQVAVWFPPNRGGLPYAASRLGAAVFS